MSMYGLWFKQLEQVPVLQIQFSCSLTDHLPEVNLIPEELHVICSGITEYLALQNAGYYFICL